MVAKTPAKKAQDKTSRGGSAEQTAGGPGGTRQKRAMPNLGDTVGDRGAGRKTATAKPSADTVTRSPRHPNKRGDRSRG